MSVPSGLVVGVDGSGASDAAVRWATREAVMRRVPMELVTVVAPTLASSTMGPNDTLTQGQEDQARQIVERARQIVDEVAGDGRPSVQAQVPYAHVVPALVEASERAQMIVVGSRGRDAFGPHRLGSVSTGLVHHAQCPVAIVHDPESVEHEISDSAPVLVGIDGSPASEAATAVAFDEASRRGVPRQHRPRLTVQLASRGSRRRPKPPRDDYVYPWVDGIHLGRGLGWMPAVLPT